MAFLEEEVPNFPVVLSRPPDLNANWECFDLDTPHPGYSPPITPRTPDPEPVWDPSLPRTPDHQPIPFEVALLQYLRDRIAAESGQS